MHRRTRRGSDYSASRGLWFLDGLTEEGQSVRRVISGRHAEIFDDHGVLKLRDLASAPDRRRQLASSQVAMAPDLGIATVAEGIESSADASACHELGFDYARGFLFGRPQSAEEIVAT